MSNNQTSKYATFFQTLKYNASHVTWLQEEDYNEAMCLDVINVNPCALKFLPKNMITKELIIVACVNSRETNCECLLDIDPDLLNEKGISIDELTELIPECKDGINKLYYVNKPNRNYCEVEKIKKDIQLHKITSIVNVDKSKLNVDLIEFGISHTLTTIDYVLQNLSNDISSDGLLYFSKYALRINISILHNILEHINESLKEIVVNYAINLKSHAIFFVPIEYRTFEIWIMVIEKEEYLKNYIQKLFKSNDDIKILLSNTSNFNIFQEEFSKAESKLYIRNRSHNTMKSNLFIIEEEIDD